MVHHKSPPVHARHDHCLLDSYVHRCVPWPLSNQHSPKIPLVLISIRNCLPVFLDVPAKNSAAHKENYTPALPRFRLFLIKYGISFWIETMPWSWDGFKKEAFGVERESCDLGIRMSFSLQHKRWVKMLCLNCWPYEGIHYEVSNAMWCIVRFRGGFVWSQTQQHYSICVNQLSLGDSHPALT